jgi:hypothetical protein
LANYRPKTGSLAPLTCTGYIYVQGGAVIDITWRIAAANGVLTGLPNGPHTIDSGIPPGDFIFSHETDIGIFKADKRELGLNFRMGAKNAAANTRCK